MDDKVIIIKPKLPKKKKSSSNLKPTEEQLKFRKIEKMVDSDVPLTKKKISQSMKLSIQRKRLEKGWSQKDLANNSQIPESTIRDYENGSAIPDQKVLVKIIKVLGPL
jgi:ribosome-binding protein aMBF1 (putative translation factor)